MRGSVYKRGSTWTWHVDIGVDPVTGRRKQQTKGGFTTKRACHAALNEALASLRAGTFVEPSARTLGGFLVDEWLPARRNLRPSTLSNYAIHIRTCVVPALGAIRLRQLSPAHLNAFYQSLLTEGRLRNGRGMAPKTVQNIHAILHRALKDALRWGCVSRNVAEAVDPPAGLRIERQGLDARAAPRLPPSRSQRSALRRLAARGDHRTAPQRARRAALGRRRLRRRADLASSPARGGGLRCGGVRRQDAQGPAVAGARPGDPRRPQGPPTPLG